MDPKGSSEARGVRLASERKAENSDPFVTNFRPSSKLDPDSYSMLFMFHFLDFRVEMEIPLLVATGAMGRHRKRVAVSSSASVLHLSICSDRI